MLQIWLLLNCLSPRSVSASLRQAVADYKTNTVGVLAVLIQSTDVQNKLRGSKLAFIHKDNAKLINFDKTS